MPRVFRRVTERDDTPFSEGFVARRKERTEDMQGWFESDPVPPTLDWVVEGFLASGDLAILAGRPKDGKTCLAAAIAQAVATGTPFAGMRTAGCPVMYFAAEESMAEWERAVLPYLPADRGGLMVTHTTSFRIDDPADLWALRVNVGRYRARLVVIDPLLAACESGDFGSAGRARHALEGFKRMCELAGVAGLVVHHAKERSGRAHRVAENPQLAATASQNMVLNWRPCDEGRIVSLKMKGRGEHANRTLELFSPGVCRYEAVGEEGRG